MKKFENLIPITIIDIKERIDCNDWSVIEFFIMFKNPDLTVNNKEKHWVDDLNIWSSQK